MNMSFGSDSRSQIKSQLTTIGDVHSEISEIPTIALILKEKFSYSSSYTSKVLVIVTEIQKQKSIV